MDGCHMLTNYEIPKLIDCIFVFMYQFSLSYIALNFRDEINFRTEYNHTSYIGFSGI
jgi:hypothetical protein